MKSRYLGLAIAIAVSFFTLAWTPAIQASQDRQEDSSDACIQSVEDPTLPCVQWVLPVQEDGAYLATGELLLLEVEAVDDVGVERVYFSRWDAMNDIHLEIGTVYEAPYHVELDTTTLNPEWNEISARAFDSDGKSSETKSIFIYMDVPIVPETQLYLPYIGRGEP